MSGIDPLVTCLLNLTGHDIYLRAPGEGSDRALVPCAGTVLWQNRSVPLLRDLFGIPRYDFHMASMGSLPPVAARFDPTTHPAYVLVDPFSALALKATGSRRPDILVPVTYEEDPTTKAWTVTALGHLRL